MAEMIHSGPDNYVFRLSEKDMWYLRAIMAQENESNPCRALGLFFAEGWLSAQKHLGLTPAEKKDFRPFTVTRIVTNAFEVTPEDNARILRSVTHEQENIAQWLDWSLGNLGHLADNCLRIGHKGPVLGYLNQNPIGAEMLRKFD